MTTHSRAPRLVVALALAAAVVPGTTGAVVAVPSATELSAEGTYLVALEQQPRAGQSSSLRRRQDALLRQVGDPRVLYRYTRALNGFAADLTREQVKRLRADPAVAIVERSTLQRPDSVDSADALRTQEAWRAAGGADDAGRGTVIGVVDTGIWPENPGFAAIPAASPRGPAGFRGDCAEGEGWDDADCNSKVVAAHYFVEGFGEENLAASEYLSPRDLVGHGSHVAAVAAGNAGVEVEVSGQKFGETAGMAPAARIASYKACWAAPDPADDGCTTADTVAAIDRAVTDGVDVLSYAISGPAGEPSDSVELAFLNATAAGVTVVASAGNDGPGTGTVAHTSPWVTTVGATTHHVFRGGLALGDGQRFAGAMVSDEAVPRARLVLARSAAAGTGPSAAEDARLCRPGSLDSRAVQDSIVVCDRGTVPRVDKSEAVARAGGVGMVLLNMRPGTVHADFHAVPTVHLDVPDAREVERYVKQADDPTAVLDPGLADEHEPPRVATFSSRGPGGADASLVKPDVTAPGVDVLSAVAPPSHGDRGWNQMSGTSMGAAHVAGLAALVRAEHPRWSPAMVKSAISTTAAGLGEGGGPLTAGAGQVDAAEALDPGIVLDARPGRFRAWLDGRVATRDLNLPSIGIGDLTGQARVVRRITNVSGSTQTYTARLVGLDGLAVAVRPRTLTLRPGETGRFALRVARVSAPLESPARGHVVWTGLEHQARLPVVITPRTVSAPQDAQGSGESGTVSFQAVAGTTGELALEVTGLAEAVPVGLTLEPGSFRPRAPRADRDTAHFPVEVPAGTAALRLYLEGRDSDDLDVYLFKDGELVASATGSGADEALTEVEPAAGSYDVYVTSTVAGNGSTTTAQLYTWVLREGDRGDLRTRGSVAVSAGEPFDVELSWRDLDPTSRWFGMVGYDGSPERTFVTVN